MSTEPGKLIGTKLSFQMNHALICGIMLVAFVLDAMPVNSAFQSALSKDSGLTTGYRFLSAIPYHGQSNLLRIEGSLNCNRYVPGCALQPEVVPFL
ncbi:uncharacterized protein TNCV_4604831 [Trichonephila clavipes]|nr:uncharacterized protein TNCV_4604831 [Trichonephila clavipes]